MIDGAARGVAERGCGRDRRWPRRVLGAVLIALVVACAQSGATFAATITVTTTADENTPNDGTVSLREAIQALNAGNSLGDPDISGQSPGVFGVNDTINFNIPAFGGTRQVINVGGAGLGALPSITQLMTINGYSQPGASQNTLVNGDNANLLIALDGAGAGPNADGLRIQAFSTIEGLDIYDFSANQVELLGGSRIEGDDLGFDTTGSPTHSPVGLRISGAILSTIGGTTPDARNVLSGNVGPGLEIATTGPGSAADNVVEGNFIGTDTTGESGDGNGRFGSNTKVGAVLIAGGDSNTIGGSTAGARNVISGNGNGVDIRDGGENNIVQGNFIGVAADGVTPLPNAGFGIHIGSSDNLAPPAGPGQANEPAASGNVIGLNPNASFGGLGNLIAFNGGDGVQVDGSVLPNNATPNQNDGNSILGNSIYSNQGLGIDLKTGLTTNKPNNLQAAPTITSVSPGASSALIQGTVHQPGSPGMALRIELFSSPSCDASGFGEGQTLIGTATASTDGSGNASFIANTASVSPGQSVTATATNTTADPSTPPGSVNVFNTSEFSRCFTTTLPTHSSPPPPPPSPLPTQSTTTSIGDQQITLTTPSQSTCTANTDKLAVTLSSTTIPRSKGAKLKFTSAGFYIDNGIKHTHRKTLHSRKGKQKTVIVNVYTANATAHRVPAMLDLSLSGLKPGVHTLKITLFYRETTRQRAHKRTVAVTKTLTTKFSVC